MDKNKYDANEEIQCRICAEFITESNGRIHIFEEDAQRNYLQSKIKKYLCVMVSPDDRLPKMVCFTCIKRLEGIHRFAIMAHRAQEKLKVLVYRSSNDDPKKEFEDHHEKNHQPFLRSILISKDEEDKGNIISLDPSDLSSPPVNSIDNGIILNTMEEMEVKVDPMIFLQCSLDRPPSPETSYTKSDHDEEDHYHANPKLKEHTGRKCEKDILIYSIDNHDGSENLTNTDPFDCNVCSCSFQSRAILQKHLWSHLPRTEWCYNKHITNTTSFNNDGSFVCPICNKKISTKGNLKVHLETHRPKGKYGCDICGRIFKTQSNLFRHKEYHSGIQFPCSVCGRVYPTNSTLRAHSITHSDLRPHACPLCDKTFKRNQDLKFHINQHTGARPYQCPYCPKAFASSGNCFSHRKRMHPDEVHRDRQRAADLMR